MAKAIATLTFNGNFDRDKRLMYLVKAVGNLPRNRGIPLASLVRNRLERVLEKELKEEQPTET